MTITREGLAGFFVFYVVRMKAGASDQDVLPRRKHALRFVHLFRREGPSSARAYAAVIHEAAQRKVRV